MGKNQIIKKNQCHKSQQQNDINQGYKEKHFKLLDFHFNLTRYFMLKSNCNSPKPSEKRTNKENHDYWHNLHDCHRIVAGHQK